MPAYIIARIKISDPVQYQQYVARSPGVVAKFGGRFLVRGGEVHPLEGEVDTNQRVVIVEFESVEKAKEFYNSEDYAEARSFRAHAAEAQFLAVPGYEAP